MLFGVEGVLGLGVVFGVGVYIKSRGFIVVVVGGCW